MNYKTINLEGEDVHIKKDKLKGWKVIKPWKNPDGSLNWFNILTGGSWSNLLLIIIFVVLAIGAISEYSQAFQLANNCLEKRVYLYGLG